MNEFFAFPHDLVGWLGLLSLVIIGLIAGFGLFDRGRSAKENETRRLDSELIDRLKEKVELLEKDVNESKKKIADLETNLNTTTTENHVLREILQGRDEATLSYQKKGLDAMKNGLEILELVKRNNMLITETNANIEKLYKAIEKHLKHLEEK